jgi:hypothetical protein
MGTPVTGVGLTHLQGLPSLEELSFLNADPDQAVELTHLISLPALRRLHLGISQIADKQFSHLLRLTSLQELDLRNLKLEARLAGELKLALPTTRIRW